MTTKPLIEDTRWAVTALGVESTLVSTPSGALKDNGYPDDDIPLAKDWNFWHRKAHAWFEYLNAGALSGNHSIAGALSVFGKATIGGESLTFTDFTFTADSASDQLTAAGHPLQTGDGPLRNINVGGAAPGGLPLLTDFYAIFVDANHIKAATTRANAIAGISIDILTNGTGTQTIQAQVGTTRVEDLEVTRNLIVDGTATSIGLLIASGGLSVGTGIIGPLTFNGVISPAALPDGNTNDYSPPGYSTAVVIRLSGSPATTPILTGLVAGPDQQIIILTNVSATTITMAHQTGSALANRFLLPTGANILLAQDQAMVMIRDGVTSRWRLLSKNF